MVFHNKKEQLPFEYGEVFDIIQINTQMPHKYQFCSSASLGIYELTTKPHIYVYRILFNVHRMYDYIAGK